ncbi:hypothetical protein [Nocardioides hwasunensis]|uniref:DUF3995 domain-containing protein n=1 Tax=Nocardioides hwasunensis TaxID=397258 RepID=A0ABR8MHR6_9ACTN|nr:hypothetical protein [Nocardioides hwasunensis]MBD3914791.1 hypothetical protein [Nocardioides hwasunensis]
MRARGGLVVVGALLMAYGGWLLLSRQDPGQWLEVLVWLAAAIVAHDVVLSGLLIGVCLLGSRLLPSPWRAPATIALVVWGGLTVAAIPVLTRLGARADNPTLLDRPYVATWCVLSIIVALAVLAAGRVRARARADDPV